MTGGIIRWVGRCLFKKILLDMGGANLPITGTADGQGHIVYDRNANYFTGTQLYMKMTMVINQGGNVMHVVVGINQLAHCDISKE
jgi:hypothetical protein